MRKQRHDFVTCLEDLAPGMVAELKMIDHDMGFCSRPIEDLARELDEDRTQATLICQADRIGILRFSARLEHEHFPPAHGQRNSLFRVAWTKWQGLEWQLIIIPMAERKLFELVASQTGMRIADGTPVRFEPLTGPVTAIGVPKRNMPCPGPVLRFPIRNDRAWTIENAADSGVYRDRATADSMRALELKEVGRYFEGRGALDES